MVSRNEIKHFCASRQHSVLGGTIVLVSVGIHGSRLRMVKNAEGSGSDIQLTFTTEEMLSVETVSTKEQFKAVDAMEQTDAWKKYYIRDLCLELMVEGNAELDSERLYSIVNHLNTAFHRTIFHGIPTDEVPLEPVQPFVDNIIGAHDAVQQQALFGRVCTNWAVNKQHSAIYTHPA
jgi:hypothetical protein